jgi:hypothetical protein
MKHPVTLLILLLMLSMQSIAQNEARKWYFGLNAGLDFSTSPPSVINNSAIQTWEGCASMCDPGTGQLLFYTDGITVYNANHVAMANGTFLFGNGSTTQSAIIVKQPGNANLWYIFTLDLQGSAQGLCYSVVDMALAAGMGSVTAKNVFLYGASTEKLTGVRHCNGTDVWIVSHEMYNNKFRSYLLTSAGVTTPAVTSVLGAVHFAAGQGYLRAASNGKKLACAQSNGSPSTLELYDFDPSTGVVSNYILVSNSIGNTWGVEFSPDCSKLYCGTIGANSSVFQWDLCAGSTAAILSSSVQVGSGASFPCLQNGPDGKIYCAQWGGANMSVINNPNAAGLGCNFTFNAISLTTGTCATGLPNFVCSYFRTNPPFAYTVNPNVSCNSATFAIPANFSQPGCAGTTYTISSFKWVFGDPASGAQNTSTLTNPVHAFTHGGTFNVRLAVMYNCGVDTIWQNVPITTPQATVTSSGVGCSSPGSSTVTMLSPGTYNYTWMPGNISGSVAATGPGFYTIQVSQTNSVCAFTTTFQISPPIPMTATVTSAASCGAPGTASVQVTPGSGSSSQFTYQWNGTAGTATTGGLPGGTHVVVVTDGLCSVTKTFVVLTGPPILVSVTPPSTVCCLVTTTVAATASGGTGNIGFQWAGGAQTPSFTTNQPVPGTIIYTVTVKDDVNCTETRTTQVTYVALPSMTVTSYTVCPKTKLTLTATGALSYSWSPGGNTTPTVSGTYSLNTTYTITGTGTNSCTSTTTAQVKMQNCTGTDDVTEQAFSIFPNPCANTLRVSSGAGALITITSVDGKVITIRKMQGEGEIDLSSEAPGIYIVFFQSRTTLMHLKLVKADL